jgi:regulator of protease activity HflC (stomatin/prohibitin superfamily)
MVQAMARQMKAEREKRAVILEAEGVREASIKRAEGEKQAAILEAEGRREAAFRDAEARERMAEAEAKATDVVAAAIAAHGTAATNYFLGQRYVEALSRMGTANNSKLIFLPLEASGIMGAISGIAEITRDAIKGGGGSGGSPSGLPPTRPSSTPPAPPSGVSPAGSAGGNQQGPWTRG